MGWEDGIALINSSFKAPSSWTPALGAQQQRQAVQSWSRTQAFSPFRVARSGLSASGGLGSTTKQQPLGFPEKVDIRLPWSVRDSQAKPIADTQGDFVGSLGASLDNAIGGGGGKGGYLNLSNAIPWGQERLGVLASQVAKDLTHDDHNIVSGALDLLSGGVKAVADVLGPVIDFIPNTLRDSQLNSRADMYKAVVTGQSIGLIDQLATAITGKSTTDARTREMLAKVIDIPDSVKRAIEQDPNVDIAKALDDAPEGRLWSYDPGLAGMAQNIIAPMAVYVAEYLATGGLAGAVGGATAASTLPGVALAGRAAATGVRGVATIQKLMLASGMGYLGASTVADAVARTVGDKAAVEWWDKVNRTALISDNPNVQLVTSFTTDPIAAAKMAKAGTIGIGRGVVRAVVPKAVGVRWAKFYTGSDTAVRDLLARAYGTTREGVEQYVGPAGAYDNWTAAKDRVVELAFNSIHDTLPVAERTLIGALKGEEAAKIIVERYGGRIMKQIDEHPEAVVNELRKDWSHHQFSGPWDPKVAAAVERDYLTARSAMEVARNRADGVVGYVDALNPEGQRIARQQVDQLFARGDVTLRDLNLLNKDFPSLRGTYHDLVAGKSAGDAVTRDVFDTAISRASDKYATEFGRNPVRATTGVDPVLRPDSPNSTQEWADALGTNAETIRAIGENPTAWKPETRDLVTTFARDKGIVGESEIAAMTPDALAAKVGDWVDTTTAPWVKRGGEVATVEKQLAQASDRQATLADLVARGQSEYRSELTAVQAERARLQQLLADVAEPVTPFSQGVRFARRESLDTGLVERARAKVDAEERLALLHEIDTRVETLNPISSKPLLSMIRRNRDGDWAWAGEKPPVSDSLYAKLQGFLSSHGGPKGARVLDSLPTQGDEAIWRIIADHKDKEAFRRTLNGAQKRLVDRTATQIDTLDEYMAKWESTGGSGTPEDFVRDLGNLRGARDDILAGDVEHLLRRTAGQELPQWAVDEARAGRSFDLYRDPESELARAAARQNLARALDGGDATYLTVKDLVNSDPLLAAEVDSIARANGLDTTALLADPAHADLLRPLVRNLDENPAVPGVPRAQTELDQAILSGDPSALEAMRTQMDDLRGTLPEPLHNVPEDAASALASRPRPSTVLASEMRDAGVDFHAVIPAEMWDAHPVAKQVSSVILHGEAAHPPRTLNSLRTVLREIENGNAANMGIGTELAAEAQRAAKRIIEHFVGDARKAQFEAGVLGMGKGLNPYTWGEDTFAVIRDLFAKKGEKAALVVRDDRLGLQYGLKQRPTDAVVLDLSTVPGLAEELLTGHSRTWMERFGTAQVRQMFNVVFGPRYNQEVFYQARGRFIDRLAADGLDANTASKVWTRWREFSKETLGDRRVKVEGKVKLGKADNRLYASERNIPNATLDRLAQEEVARLRPDLNPEAIDFSEAFRISTSFVRRQLEKVPTLGGLLQQMYGTVMHNAAVTTFYYMFRFKLDFRFHAQNNLEGPFLYLGRAALRQDRGHLIVGDEGLFGASKAALSKMTENTLDTVGIPFSHTRDAWAYKTFLKEQPDKLRGLMTEDPALFEDALKSLARLDPELSATVKAFGDTPESYLRLLDKHYRKVLDSADPAAAVSREIMQDVVGDPALAALYGRLDEVNTGLIESIRGTFYGNPSRSNLERWANHYLLYWPISYQIKATKWLARVMFDRAGGVKTNAGGAWTLDQFAQFHDDRLHSDPEYAAFFEEHPTLLFVAQMLLPLSPASIGVSLSPGVRDVFFGGTKQVSNVGPVYTFTKLVPQLAGELYPDLSSVPGVDPLYRGVTGYKPPKG